MSSTTAPPPLPSMAQIPLPPGMTLEQFLTLQGQLGVYFLNSLSGSQLMDVYSVTIAITVAVAFGVVLWD